MKVTHTHRGHCQFCLRVHAIDVQTGRLAKHGYNVEHGYFRGECPGSGELSLHVERRHSDVVILGYRDQEHVAKLTADSYENGTRVPGAAWDCVCWRTSSDGRKHWEGKYHKETRPDPLKPGQTKVISVRTMLPWSEANEEQRARQLEEVIGEARSRQHRAKHLADEMVEWARRVHDEKMPAYRNEDLDNPLKVGDTVHLGGEKGGFDCKVEAIEVRPYVTHGYMRGRTTVDIPHARVTRPGRAAVMTKDGKRVKAAAVAAYTYWEPLRNIKAPKGSLVDQLKTAGFI